MTRGNLRLIALGIFPTICTLISNVIQLVGHDSDVQTGEIIWNGLVITLIVITSITTICLAAKESGSTVALKIGLTALFSQGIPLIAAAATVSGVRWTALSGVSLAFKSLVFMYQIIILIK